MILTISKKKMMELDLTEIHQYVVCSHEFIMRPPGEEHYRLLSHLVSQLPAGSKVVDVGTSTGNSALSMAYENNHVHVRSCDIVDNLPTSHPNMLMFKNIEFVIEDGVESTDSYMGALLILLDIDPHDGNQEKLFVRRMFEKGFRGIILCDDTRLNSAMKEFYDSIDYVKKKMDLTPYGHWSGTAALIFDPDYIDLEIAPE